MAKPKILVDTSFLLAIYNQNDRMHQKAVSSVQIADLLIPQIVLVEAVYFFKAKGGVPAAVKFLNGITTAQTPLESITYADLSRASDIMTTYADSRLDFVDCCIMALAERLNITQVYTFDRRDFSIFRPQHCPHLELLPEV
jgi:predicted nucleic acid-binding protein